MADLKISELTELAKISGTEMIPVQNGSGNNKVSISTIRGGLQPSGDYALKSEVETAITEINSSIGDVSSIIDDINAEEV